MSYQADQHGFTLLELLIVALLVSISLAISIPTLRHSIVSDQLAAGSRKVISLIQSGRSKAIRERTPYIIHIDPAQQKLWYQPAETDEQSAGPSGNAISLPAGIRIQRVEQANASDEHSPEKDGLWISKQGYMDQTSIQLVDRKNDTITLLISPFLHRIKILDQASSFH